MVRQVLTGRCKQLRRVQVAKRVGREVAEGAHGPVDVLQHSKSAVRRSYAEELLVHVVPCVWEVVDFEITRDEFLLDFVTDHNVHIVGGFVGLNANQTRLHKIDCLPQRFRIDSIHVLGKVLLPHWQGPLTELTRAADLILP